MNAGKTWEPVGDTAAENVAPIPTVGEVFGDGAMIELMAGASVQTPRLVLWDGIRETVGTVVKHGRLSYQPSRVDPSFLRELRLPSHRTSAGPTREILADICKLVTKFSGLEEKPVSVVGRFVLCTWLIENLQLAPALIITGPYDVRGNQLLELLHCVCRHGLRLSSVTPAGLCSLPTEMGFTLLISQPMIGPKLSKFLDDISKRGQKVPRRGGLLDFFGAQVIRSESLEGGEFHTERFVQIPMIPVSEKVPSLDEEEKRRIATEFQDKLLGFRCTNVGKTDKPDFDASKFGLALRPLAQSLAAATPDEPKLQAAIHNLLGEENEEIRSRSWTQISTIAIEAVRVACFESMGEVKYIGELAEIAQELLRRRGADVQVDPGALGRQLRLLGFTPEPRDARGVKLKLTEDVQRRAQRLAQDLGVPVIGQSILGKAPQGGGDGSGTRAPEV